VPVLGLADWNPFGLALLLTYKIGSERMAHEGSKYTVDLKYLGLRSSQIDTMQLASTTRQAMKDIDVSKCNGLLRSDFMQQDGSSANSSGVGLYIKEVKLMLSRNFKCELEAIMSKGMSYFSSEFLPLAITTKDYF
jgi:meiotic recombination protein SPO11